MNLSPWFAQRTERQNRAMRKHAGTNRRRPLVLDLLEERMLLSGFLQPASSYVPSGAFAHSGEYAGPVASANTSDAIAPVQHVRYASGSTINPATGLEDSQSGPSRPVHVATLIHPINTEDAPSGSPTVGYVSTLFRP